MSWTTPCDSTVEIGNHPITCEDIWSIARGASISVHNDRLIEMNKNASAAADIPILAAKQHWLTGNPELPDQNLAEGFILGHCAGVGEPFSDDIVRGAIAARITVLSAAMSGCRSVVVERLMDLLNNSWLPKVPSQGSVGAAGDLAPMAYIARRLCGYDDFHHPNFSPLNPTDKEALSLINGISLSTAIASIAVVRAERVFTAAIWAAGLTMEVVQAQSKCIDPRGLDARNHPEVSEVGQYLRTILKGSQRVVPDNNPDAFSIRAGPSVMGAVWRTIRFAREEVERELNGVSDNPLIVDNESIETGNFHGATIGMAMDHLKTALTQLATLSERRIFRLTHGKLSKNLPSFLVDGTGLNSGFMLAQYTAAALASEMKGLAHPASVDTIPTVQHHEDHVSMSPIAGRMALDSLECLADVIAIELLVGAQALDLRFRDDQIPPPDRLQQLHTHIRKVVSFWHDDEVLHPSISAMSHMVRQGLPLP